MSGARPSKTLELHRLIHAGNAQTRRIVHTHSTSLVALTLAGVWGDEDVLAPITPYYVMKVGHVPLVRCRRPGDPRAAAEIAARAMLLERLGPVVWERSVSHASYALEELEETARLWLMSEVKPEPLGEKEIEKLCGAFGVRW